MRFQTSARASRLISKAISSVMSASFCMSITPSVRAEMSIEMIMQINSQLTRSANLCAHAAGDRLDRWNSVSDADAHEAKILVPLGGFLVLRRNYDHRGIDHLDSGNARLAGEVHPCHDLLRSNDCQPYYQDLSEENLKKIGSIKAG